MLLRNIHCQDWMVRDLQLLKLPQLGAQVVKAAVKVGLALVLVLHLLIGRADRHSFLLLSRPLWNNKIHIIKPLIHLGII